MRWSRFHFCPFEGVCPCVHTVCQINSVNCKTVGAYRIRPQMSENETIAANTLSPSNIHLRRHGGRMRCAPTALQLTELI